MTQTEQHIKQRLREHGQLTFAEFMSIALYSRGGYYHSGERVGDQGDYYTSPSTHPGFGAVIALQLEEMWREMDSPETFWVIEPGSGDGTMAHDITQFAMNLEPAFIHALRYVAIDLREPRYKESPFGRVVSSDWPFQGIVGCILSNELVDSMPVHRVAMLEGKLRERYLTLEGDQIVERIDDPSTRELEHRLDEDGGMLAEGNEGEIGLAAARWVQEVAGSLARGYVITIDYGDMSDQLYSVERAKGTVSAYYRHSQQSDLYARPGLQDLTAHANFSTLIQSGSHGSLTPLVLMTQREFLRNLGIDVFIDAITRNHRAYSEWRRNLAGLRELIKPGGLGDFRVLVQAKGVPGSQLSCLGRPDSSAPLSERLLNLPIPILDSERIDLAVGRYPHVAWENADRY